MDRIMVYPGAIPLDTDMLATNRNAMVALGALAQMVVGSAPVVDGLACTPTSPASLSVVVQPGSITQLSVVDALAFGSMAADAATKLVKMGINLASMTFSFLPPTTPGQVVNYLIQAAFQEADVLPVVLPYYNAANPAQPFSGPANSGAAQATLRAQQVQLQVKGGVPAAAGSQSTPIADSGWVPLHVVTLAYGQTSVDATAITSSVYSPALQWKLPALRPGFGSGVQTFTASGLFVVPAGVSQVEVEVWGAGAGSFASTSSLASGGGSGGGYARKRLTGLGPGQQIAVTVGAGGAAGGVGGPMPTAGGASSFGSWVSASGGALNYLATVVSPQNGATPPGIGIGGDVNLSGSAGQAGMANQGGLGGAGAMGGTQNSGTTGVAGLFPGGGAAGAGTGATGATAYAGAAGAGGQVVVRW